MRFIKFNNAIVNIDFVKYVFCEEKTVRMYIDGGNLSIELNTQEDAKNFLNGVFDDIKNAEGD